MTINPPEYDPADDSDFIDGDPLETGEAPNPYLGHEDEPQDSEAAHA